MMKGLLPLHPSIVVLEIHAPMVLYIIIEDHILDLLLIRIRLDTYLLVPLVYPILQLLTYLSNHVHLSQLLAYLRNHL